MFLILFKLISSIPLFILRFFSNFLTFWLLITNSQQKNTTQRNLKHIGLQNKISLTTSLIFSSETFFEYPFLWGRPNNFKKLVECSVKEPFQNSSKPKLIFTLHMGCVDAMLFFVSSMVDNLNIIFTPAKNKSLDNVIKKIRESRGAKLHPANPRGMNAFIKSFIKKENIIIATDLVPHNTGKYSTFFGKECFSIDLIEKLSKKGTHDLYFAYFSKGTQKKYKLNIESVENFISTDEMNKYFERAIRINPEMYGWEYKKFRKLPGSKKNIY
tara:strand:+ start:7010 stop:7822 length:813 start_codon:yes stop_codon:yes gene_type:complete